MSTGTKPNPCPNPNPIGTNPNPTQTLTHPDLNPNQVSYLNMGTVQLKLNVDHTGSFVLRLAQNPTQPLPHTHFP